MSGKWVPWAFVGASAAAFVYVYYAAKKKNENTISVNLPAGSLPKGSKIPPNFTTNTPAGSASFAPLGKASTPAGSSEMPSSLKGAAPLAASPNYVSKNGDNWVLGPGTNGWIGYRSVGINMTGQAVGTTRDQLIVNIEAGNFRTIP